MLVGTIQKVSRTGILTIWSEDLREFTFAAKWHDRLPGLVGCEVEFEEGAGRAVRTIRLTRPNIVHRVRLEPASGSEGAASRA